MFCRTSQRSRYYACLSGIRYGAGEWTPFPHFGASPILVSLYQWHGAGGWTGHYFTRPRERTRPFGEDVRGHWQFLTKHGSLGSASQLASIPVSPGLFEPRRRDDRSWEFRGRNRKSVNGTRSLEFVISPFVLVKWNYSSFPMNSRAIP